MGKPFCPSLTAALDFLSGVAYAQGGVLKRVSNATFIITPYDVNIMGDVLDELKMDRSIF